MANPAITYTFSNSTTADATQVNQNFTDIINGLTDGTKSLTIDSLTANGASSLKGTVTLGDSSSDDLTFTGSLASTIPIKTTGTYNLGSATLGLLNVYLGNATNSNTVALKGGVTTASYSLTLPTAAPAAASYIMEFTAAGVGSFVSKVKLPTVSKLTATAGANYTTPASVTWLEIELIGPGGGGGAGSNTGSFGAGADGSAATTFGGVLSGGLGRGGTSAAANNLGGAGGAATVTASSTVIEIATIAGANGGVGKQQLLNDYVTGGAGASTRFGGGAAGGQGNVSALTNAPLRSGAGGGGGGAGNGGAAGAGGGAGGYVKAIIVPTALQVFAYVVGSGGSGNGAGSFSGSNGADGSILITEHYT